MTLTEICELKVIVVANEDKIKDDISYREKVVGKTIRFTPDVISIYSSIVASYGNKRFSQFMGDNTFMINSLNAQFGELKDVDVSKLEENLTNIRTLKFAIEHFYHIFDELMKDVESTAQWTKKLNNIWAFVLGVSIELKINAISHKERHNLDRYEKLSFLPSLDWGSSSSSNEEHDEYKFAKTFAANYHTRLSESFVYYASIYDYLTSGDIINYAELREQFISEFKAAEMRPYVALWQKFSNGIWKMTEEEFKNALRELLSLISKGEVLEIGLYPQACMFLFHFADIIGEDAGEIKTAAKEGARIFISTLTRPHSLMRSSFKMVSANYKDSAIVEVSQFIDNLLDEAEKMGLKKEGEELAKQFMEDSEKFVQIVLNRDGRPPKYLNTPILQWINDDVIKDKVSKMQPCEVMTLASLVKERYTNFISELKLEKSFLESLKTHIEELNPDTPTLSNHYIKLELLPALEEAIKKMDT